MFEQQTLYFFKVFDVPCCEDVYLKVKVFFFFFVIRARS